MIKKILSVFVLVFVGFVASAVAGPVELSFHAGVLTPDNPINPSDNGDLIGLYGLDGTLQAVDLQSVKINHGTFTVGSGMGGGSANFVMTFDLTLYDGVTSVTQKMSQNGTIYYRKTYDQMTLKASSKPVFFKLSDGRGWIVQLNALDVSSTPGVASETKDFYPTATVTFVPEPSGLLLLLTGILVALGISKVVP